MHRSYVRDRYKEGQLCYEITEEGSGEDFYKILSFDFFIRNEE